LNKIEGFSRYNFVVFKERIMWIFRSKSDYNFDVDKIKINSITGKLKIAQQKLVLVSTFLKKFCPTI